MRAMLSAFFYLLLAGPAAAVDAEDAPPPPKARGEAALVEALAPILKDEALKGARFSVLLTGPRDETLYAISPSARLHPASNTKLVTTAAALVKLGPAFTYKTDLATDRLEHGVAGTLYLIGGGDARFLSEHLWKLVDELRAKGITEVGDVVVDERRFTSRRLAPGFEEKDQDAAYRAASSAASLDFNAVSVRVVPGDAPGDKARVILRPGGGYIELDNTATTIGKGRARIRVRAKAHAGRTRIKVRGRIPRRHRGINVRKRIDEPALFTAHALAEQLERAGIRVKGVPKVGASPRKRKRLARHISTAMGRYIADVNKYSNNHMAESLVLTLGQSVHGKGDWETGRRVIMSFLEKQVGLRSGKYRLANGSGLFGDTRLSALQLTRVLQYMRDRRPALPEYAASLAIAGTDGTLRTRNKKAEVGVIRAKTGTLDGVICVSGYISFADGSPGTFSILMNDVKAKPWKIWTLQDRMLEIFAGQRPGKGRKKGK